MYRITPHSTTGVPPADLLMGCRLRSRFDALYPDIGKTVETRQWHQKKSHDGTRAIRIFVEGDKLLVKSFTNNSKWLPGVITGVTGPLSYTVT